VDGNNTPAFGTQVTFYPTPDITLNSSSFIGNDKPDSLKQMRYFHNFYSTFKISSDFGITLGFDYGAEEKPATDSSSEMNTWMSPVLILRYALSDQCAIAGRAEYYADENGVIIATGTENGFQTTGFSINFDYAPVKQVLLRLEGRTFTSTDQIFTDAEGKPTDTNTFITSSLAISF
jgi:hypothetical protein